MTDFDQVLENCLGELANGSSTLDECLLRYPEHSVQLQPLLRTAVHIARGQAVRPSATFKARTRAKLTLHMHANPRKRTPSSLVFWKFAISLSAIVLVLFLTGTAYAQSALPGDPFYRWKLVSERAWRLVSSDPIGTDIAIANRRIEEMNRVANDPILRAMALEGYREVVSRLQSELGPEALKQILPIFEFELEPIDDSGQPIPGPTMIIIEPIPKLPQSTAFPIPSLPSLPVPLP